MIFLLISMLSGALWLGASLAVDVVAVPALFRNLPDIAMAGKVGMVVFSRFNKLEMILAIIGLLTSAGSINLYRTQKKKCLLQAAAQLILVAIAVLFTFAWTPAIIQYADQMFTLPIDHADYQNALTQHRFFHKAYVRVEGVKLLVLVLSIIVHLITVLSFKEHKQGALA